MPFDALALHAVRDEIEAEATDALVERVLLLDQHSVALELYRHRHRFGLLVSIQPAAARVHLLSRPPSRTSDAVTPLLLLLRKYLRGGRIVAAVQPRLERVLTLRIDKRDDTGFTRAISLIIEVMGRRSNLILVGEDGVVLDALRRATPEANPSRPVLAHLRYQPPPAQERLDPLQPSTFTTLAGLARAQAGARLSDLLPATVAGCSPALAREVAARALGDPAACLGPDLPWERVAAAFAELLAPLHSGTWEPVVVRRDGLPLDFMPYRPCQFPDASIERHPSMSAALEAFYDASSTHQRFAALRLPLQHAITERLEVLERRRQALERELQQAAEAEHYRQAGEAILANLSQIEPGASVLRFAGAEYALDPALSPLENARRYFAAYRKARDAAAAVPERLTATEHERAYLEELAVLVANADDQRQFNALRAELEAVGALAPARPRQQPDQTPRGGLLRRRTSDGYEVLIGTSGRGNAEITFERAAPDDLWLHARGIPGAHVILRTHGGNPPDRAIQEAASWAAYHSRARQAAVVPVDVTVRKLVRKIKGAPPGLVTYSGERTLFVRPQPPPAPPTSS